MRAWELYEGEGLDRHRSTARRPILTLRHINKLKRLKAVQRGKHERRLALWNLMYGQDAAEERKLDQREADLDGREQELRMKELQADIEKSINDAEVDQKARNRLHQLAMAALHRRQKKHPET
jgi:hypothetical protein